MSPGAPIALEGLVFCPLGKIVLSGLTAAIPGRGVTALIGPNGAGKSVTLRLIDGLLQPDAGAIRFGARSASEVRRAFVFQKPGLIRASVAANVAVALAPLRLLARAAAERVEAALRQVGLAERAADAARKLSGGEQQRLALARALVTEPELLLLDEPTASLDPGATEAIEEIVAVTAEGGTKVLLVSHNLGQVARLASDVIVLSQGRAVEHGPVRSVLTAPRTPEARTYITGELPWRSFAAAC
jgi:tungstate transport system ATP-binding protein